MQSQAEDRVREEALEASGGRPRRPAGGDAVPHAGLHQQERRGDGGEPEQQRRRECRRCSQSVPASPASNAANATPVA